MNTVVKIFILILFFGVWSIPKAEAFLRIRPPGLGFLIWDKAKPFKYNIYEPAKFDAITHDEFATILQDNYKKWADALHNQIVYTYLGLTTQDIEYIPNHGIEAKDVDGIQTHRVVRDHWSDLALSSSAVAVTLLVNDRESIVDVDVVYNEDRYNFCKDINTCRANEIYLPPVVLHEMGHQIGFDHPSARPSIMQSTTEFKADRTLEQTDIAGVTCTYNKGVVPTEEYATACAYAENEGSVGNPDIYLSSAPQQLSGCGTLGPPPSSGSHREMLLFFMGLVICCLGLRSQEIKNGRIHSARHSNL